MYYVYVSKTDTEPVRFEDVNTASAFIMNQSQPTETLLFNEETHARFLARREGSKHTGRIKELMELHDCSRPWLVSCCGVSKPATRRLSQSAAARSSQLRDCGLR